MTRFFYDLHIHSCLSPCGDNESTPHNIAGMGKVNGLHIMALTDHNTARNCPAFFQAAQELGIVPIAGMELTTSEEIHVVCLFEQLQDAMRFSDYVGTRRTKIPNRKDIFGEQLVMNAYDEVMDEEPFLLTTATTISIDEVCALVGQYGGICYPAHIDREAYGVIGVLGAFPHDSGFTCAELHDPANAAACTAQYGLEGLKLLFDSDAHCYWDVAEQANSLLLEADPANPDEVRSQLFKALR